MAKKKTSTAAEKPTPKATEAQASFSVYTMVTTVNHNGIEYTKGDKVELSPEVAEVFTSNNFIV